MPHVARRPLAQADMLEIWDYIADDNPAAADRWMDQLDAQFPVLATQPKWVVPGTNWRQVCAAFLLGGTLFSTYR